MSFFLVSVGLLACVGFEVDLLPEAELIGLVLEQLAIKIMNVAISRFLIMWLI
jgi:hypothetical protein